MKISYDRKSQFCIKKQRISPIEGIVIKASQTGNVFEKQKMRIIRPENIKNLQYYFIGLVL